jgi:restriction system protein
MLKSMGSEISKVDAGDSWSPTDTINGWGVRLATKMKLDKDSYRLIRNVSLPTGNGGDRIDHVVVSQYGVFVVETTNMKGRIFGGAEQKAWVRQSGKRKQAFANPLVQADRHARVVAAMLGLDAGKVFPVLAFVNDAVFESQMPENVTKGSDYVRYIKSKTVPIITRADAALIVHRLESGQFNPAVTSRAAPLKRPQSAVAKAKTDTKACPDCGSPMVLRKAKKGAQAGKIFWVCSDFPKCMATIEKKVAVKPSAVPDFGPAKLQ